MPKSWILGIGIIGLGQVVAYFHSGSAGVLTASICLIVGVTLMVAGESLGLASKPGGARAKRRQAQIMVLVKAEVHAYPHHDGRFHEILDPNQTHLDFEVFINCWLVLASELSLGIADLQLTLKGADGFTKMGERVTGDLKNWNLRGKERSRDEESDWKKANLRAAIRFTELDTATPLECGSPREGWLHFSFRDTNPMQFKGGSFELSVRDCLSQTHTGVGSRVLLPGSVWPITKGNTSEGNPSEGSPNPPQSASVA